VSFTYDPTALDTDLAKVRTLIGDTDSNDPLLTDEQIAFFTSESGNIYLAAANAIDYGVLPALARDIDRNGTGFSASRSQKFQHYKDLSEKLRSRAESGALVVMTGCSVDQQSSLESDSDYVPAAFGRGRHDL
jgi:hypothetical protein